MRLVPRTRLLIWTALLVVPPATLAGVWPASLWPAAALIALFVIIVLFDAAGAPRRLEQLSIECDPVTRLSKDRPGLAIYPVSTLNQALAVLAAHGGTVPPPVATPVAKAG